MKYYHPKFAEAGNPFLDEIRFQPGPSGFAFLFPKKGELEDAVFHPMHLQIDHDLQSESHEGIRTPDIKEKQNKYQ